MQLTSNAILLLLSLLATFAHCTPPPSLGKPNPSTNGRKAKNNPPTSAGVISSVAKVVTGVLALNAAGLPGADCAPRPFGYDKPAETAENSITAAGPILAQPTSAPTQSFSPDDFKSPPPQQEMRRRMMNKQKQINAVAHFAHGGGGGHSGGSHGGAGGHEVGGVSSGGVYNPGLGAHGSSTNTHSTPKNSNNDKGSWDCCC
ncbi:hypothetical protein niasHT_003968 [Heterodera trifolii]|uniref:Uncharacterized protein n=1 Tax=Heterodera trifolii TaxID=157864 RepID=A0ABD2M533_9BILA